MEKLIPLISDIHDIIRKSETAVNLDLPIIAVVGSQSTGKSSLLQAIIGKELLPRGKGIVTRRPIEIQLVNSNVETDYVQFTDRKGEKIFSFDAVRKTISQETEKVCGGNKNINPLPIKIKIFSPNVVDLLLVDLPGMVKNPSEGQPEDIQQRVLSMIKQYICNDNCIIMAVSKATDDVANSESLKLARTVDPEGVRTIGVLTQMDLSDDSVDIIRDFSKLSTSLKLGYVGVYLRPSKLSGQLTLDQQYVQEEEFFKKHQVYHKYSSEIGVKFLIKTLNTNFIKHIKKTLPAIREQILSTLETKKQQLSSYGQYDSITDKRDQGLFVLDSLERFVRSYQELIEGRSIDNMDQLVGGARIEYIFSTIFNDSILMMDPFEFLNDADLRVAIRNANGLRKSLFVAEVAFQNLIRQQISRLLMPSLECSELVHDQLKRLLYLINIKEMQRFQKLHLKMISVMDDLLKRSLCKTQQMIRNLIQIQMGYINNNHPDFINTLANVKSESKKNADSDTSSRMDFQFEYKKSVPRNNNRNKQNSQVQLYNSKLANSLDHQEKVDGEEKSQSQDNKSSKVAEKYLTKYYNYFPRYPLPPVPDRITMAAKPKPREQTQTDLIKKLIVSYFNVVKKSINDVIPKTIVTFLINQSKNNCQKVLVSSLYKQADFDQLLVQNQALLKKRDEVKKVVMTLKSCLNQIVKVSGRFS